MCRLLDGLLGFGEVLQHCGRQRLGGGLHLFRQTDGDGLLQLDHVHDRSPSSVQVYGTNMGNYFRYRHFACGGLEKASSKYAVVPDIFVSTLPAIIEQRAERAKGGRPMQEEILGMLRTIRESQEVTNSKLEALTMDVRRLEGEVVQIKRDVAVLKQDVTELKEDVAVLKQDVTELKEDVAVLKQDVAGLKEDVVVLKRDVAELKEDVAVLMTETTTMKTEMTGFSQQFDHFEQRFDNMEADFKVLYQDYRFQKRDIQKLKDATGLL